MSTARDRAADARLAWVIVGGCAALSLCLLVALVLAMRRPVERWAEDSMRRQAAMHERLAAAYPTAPPVDISATGPAPADTVRPIGSPAAWIGPEDYPRSALRQGDEGRVRVTVSVAPTGAPSAAQSGRRAGTGRWTTLPARRCSTAAGSRGRNRGTRPCVTGHRRSFAGCCRDEER